jgi:hypothetical protein
MGIIMYSGHYYGEFEIKLKKNTKPCFTWHLCMLDAECIVKIFVFG